MSHGKVIAFTPAGRKRYMEILAMHVAKQYQAGHIDEWVLFENAYTEEDKAYTYELAASAPYIKVITVPDRDDGHRDAYRISEFYSQLTDEDAIYVRLDDDICYIAPEAIKRLVEYRLANPEPYLVFTNTINNTRISYMQQQEGCIPFAWGTLTNEILDPIAWQDGNFVTSLHLGVTGILERRLPLEGSFAIHSRVIDTHEHGHISVNCFAMLGKDMVNVASRMNRDEERSLSLYIPQYLERFNAICGDAIVVHFAYHTQTAIMESTNLLEDYKKIAQQNI